MSGADNQALIARLAAIVGGSYVLTSDNDCAPHVQDWRGRYHGKAACVVRPGNTDEVSAVVRACYAAGVAMVPQGGNTGLVGGGVPGQGGQEVVVSLSRLNRIRSIDAHNNTLIAEAGCTLVAVQAAAAESQRLFPLSLASEGSCQIGGNLATNAGGVHVLRYGNMRELTLGLEVVLPDGQVWDGLRGLRKDNTGYDLKQLFIGAEGTLGIITAAVLKLFPQPLSRTVAWLSIPGPATAIELLAHLRNACGERLSAFELIAGSALELVLRHIPGARSPLTRCGDWALLVELSDSASNADLAGLLGSALASELEAGRVLDAVVSSSEAQVRELWALRENISEAQKREGISIKHDVSVPVGAVPAFIEQADMALRKFFPGLRIVCFGHAGDGNLHYNLSQPDAADNPAFIAQTREVNRIVYDIVMSLGGSISAEHGIGILKREELKHYKSFVEIELMQQIKRAMDPENLMNPGKLL
ncbi:FAD-binding oxidoreductase [Viridibacterium curvum]|uniref:FAD-binding oxidoreductase n=1 Tax=Viridibacterium curvum TaxID=1101404 RepID=A0ABP9QXP5_9RHOO